jgi:hypothetical protein
MSIIFIAVALHRPMPRIRVGDVDCGGAVESIFGETFFDRVRTTTNEDVAKLGLYG